MLVNKEFGLPPGYVPDDLVEPRIPFTVAAPSPQRLLRREAAQAVERLFAQAQRDGITLYGVSGYRPYERQKAIFEWKTLSRGEEAARFNAPPGHSEHQTGLALDVSSRSVGFQLIQAFAETAEGRWLAEHAPAFGFIIRYPKGKEAVTGYAYEPWHLRFVGPEAAHYISANDLTLEEYLWHHWLLVAPFPARPPGPRGPWPED